MKTVLITGARGFIGKNLRAQLELTPDIHILTFDRSNSMKDLAGYVSRADFIFHLAGVMRPKEEAEFNEVNTGLTAQILTYIDSVERAIPLLVTSSIQAKLDNPYGVSKRDTELLLMKWSKETKNPIYIYRLPNVFGKWARPNYSSVVATFCNNIANDIAIDIHDPSKEMSLAYIDDVVDHFIDTMNNAKVVSKDTFYDIDRLFSVTLGDLAKKVRALRDAQKKHAIPQLNSLLDTFLYATYSSYSNEEELNSTLTIAPDESSEVIKLPDTSEPPLSQTFISVTKSGMMRVEPEHRSEVENLLILEGTGIISLKDHYSNNLVIFDCKKFSNVEVPAGYTHSLTNTGSTDLLILHRRSVAPSDKIA